MSFKSLNNRPTTGLTLIELVIVVAILAIVSTFIVFNMGEKSAEARTIAAQASLNQIRDAIMGTPGKPGYLSDTGQLPQHISDLVVQPAYVNSFNRDTGVGWNGPYLFNVTGKYVVNGTFTSTYEADGNPAVIDPWGKPFIVQRPADDKYARVVSAGPNKAIDTNGTISYPLPLPASDRGDDIVLFLQHADAP